MDGMNILLPSEPMVIVQRFGNSKPDSSAAGTSPTVRYMTSQKERTLTPATCSRFLSYKFVNSNNPEGNKDLATRKIVRYHGRHRNTSTVQKHAPRYAHGPFSNKGKPISTFVVPPIFGEPTALSSYSYPIEMNPGTHALLDKYLTHASTRMHPLKSCFKSDPFRSPRWFHFAVTDAAMLHGVLYAGAVYLALLQGKRESRDTIYHSSQTISIIQQRLRDTNSPFDDSTLGAISCLALGEAVLGNQDLWHLHMKGLKQIIQARGDISPLDPLMQAKLRRSDITGAIDHAAAPYLTFSQSNNPPIWSVLPPQHLQDTEKQMHALLSMSQVHPALITALTHLAHFSLAVQEARRRPKGDVLFDPNTFAEDLYWIEYKLLSFPQDPRPDVPDRTVEKACRIGALLYTKAILQEFPNSMTGSSILLVRLREALSGAAKDELVMPVVVWACTIGALSGKNDEKWFVDRLGKTSGASTFDELAGDMSALLSLKDVFGDPECESVWREIVDARSDEEIGG